MLEDKCAGGVNYARNLHAACMGGFKPADYPY